MVKKDKILQEINDGVKQTEIAKKYDVSDAYISQLIKREELKKKARNFDFLKMLIERKAIKIIASMMSEEELEHLEEI